MTTTTTSPALSSAAPQRTRNSGWRRRETRLGLLYSAPASLFVVVLFVIPLGLAVVMSLNDWPLIGRPEFNAPENYAAIADNEIFVGSIVFTVTWAVVTTVLFLVIGLSIALLMQNSRPGVGFFRTAVLMPAAVGLASCSLLFVALYNPDFGWFDDLLRALGIVGPERVDVLADADTAFYSVLAMVLWRFAGFNMIILLTGLQSIPLEVYEASRSDGASWWQTLRFVTLPLMKRTILLILVLSVTGGLLAFEPFYVMTQGGPANSTVTMVMAMFREAFTFFDLGSAAAIAMVLLIVLVAVNALQLFLFRDREARR
jgi:multiple sugar transport system permease protein